MKRLAFASLFVSSAVWAAGFEIPDNGTEALGRGAAFTAKADDATAIEYNLGGLAQQRGTRVLYDSNLVFNSYEFTRAGSYPAETVPAGQMPSPYVGMPFPKVRTSGVFYAPFFGITSDFGKLDRWTFALGAYGPPSVGSRNYGLTVKGPTGGDLPSPARYDLVKADLLIVFPTLAAAFRATHWLDLGVALQLVVATFDLENASYSDLGPNLCGNNEYQPCDAPTHLHTSGVHRQLPQSPALGAAARRALQVPQKRLRGRRPRARRRLPGVARRRG
jgi:long-chain fatty acid transport protein